MAAQKRFFATTPRAPRPSVPARRPAVVEIRRSPPASATPVQGYTVAAPMPPGSRGLAIGWGLPEGVEVPGWGLVLAAGAPRVPDLPAARRAIGAHAEVPLLLIGNGAGVQTVFSCFIANQTITVCGAAFFGDSFPANEYSLSLWIHLAERAANKTGLRLLTDLRGGDKSLSAVLGGSQAPANGPEGESPTARINRLLAAAFGPKSPAMPRPVPPVEHLKG